VWVSARTGAGLDILAEAVERRLRGAQRRYRLVLPPGEGRLRAALHARSQVRAESYGDSGETVLVVDVDPSALESILGGAAGRVLVEVVPLDAAATDAVIGTAPAASA
jgi:GTP-binding protein HflX